MVTFVPIELKCQSNIDCSYIVWDRCFFLIFSFVISSVILNDLV